ncbi:MAG: hypothetical protein ACPGJS_23755 [Flammeovirgaceae bacterium]
MEKQQQKLHHQKENTLAYKRDFHLTKDGIYVEVEFSTKGLNEFNYTVDIEQNEVEIRVRPIVNGKWEKTLVKEQFTIPSKYIHRIVEERVLDDTLYLTFMKDFRVSHHVLENQFAQTA